MNAAKVLEDLKRRFPNEPEYHQAVEEVLSTIEEEYNKHPEFDKANLIERLCIPDRVYQFRVTWVDDKGNVQTNMGYRVQHNNAIGPYKGGVRFHASVNLSILKFLAFEQTFKNSLTTLPMGADQGVPRGAHPALQRVIRLRDGLRRPHLVCRHRAAAPDEGTFQDGGAAFADPGELPRRGHLLPCV